MEDIKIERIVIWLSKKQQYAINEIVQSLIKSKYATDDQSEALKELVKQLLG